VIPQLQFDLSFWGIEQIWITLHHLITNNIRADLVTPCGSRVLQHNVGPDDDVKNLSREIVIP